MHRNNIENFSSALDFFTEYVQPLFCCLIFNTRTKSPWQIQTNYCLNHNLKFLTTMLKWWRVLLGRKFSELLYLSDERISQVNFPALSGKAAMLKEKHFWLPKQENAHDKLSLTTRLARAMIFKTENLSSWK